jgi:hypothetical protein
VYFGLFGDDFDPAALCIGVTPTKTRRKGDPTPKFSSWISQCLANLGKVLAVHGFAALDIRRLVVYVVGELADLSAAWGAVTEYFDGQVAPATLLGVARLGYRGQVVEIDATVVGQDMWMLRSTHGEVSPPAV